MYLISMCVCLVGSRFWWKIWGATLSTKRHASVWRMWSSSPYCLVNRGVQAGSIFFHETNLFTTVTPTFSSSFFYIHTANLSPISRRNIPLSKNRSRTCWPTRWAGLSKKNGKCRLQNMIWVRVIYRSSLGYLLIFLFLLWALVIEHQNNENLIWLVFLSDSLLRSQANWKIPWDVARN